jgi:hypothetical protein
MAIQHAVDATRAQVAVHEFNVDGTPLDAAPLEPTDLGLAAVHRP